MYRFPRLLAAATALVLAAVTTVYLLWPAQASSPPWPSTGEASIAVDGTLLPGPGADRVVPIASVAKIMTALVVLRDHPLRNGAGGPAIVVQPAEAAAYADQLANGESLVPVRSGERLDEREALEALLLPSADNMAWILARWDAGDQAAFVAKMNAEAHRLGMHRTTYTDSSGLDPNTVSTVADQLLVGAAAMQVPTLATIVAERTAVVPVAGRVHNYNTLLGQDGVIGLKTGSTSAAGGCMLFAARTADGLMIGAVLGQPGTGRAMLAAALTASRRLIIRVMSQG
jgi:serine-type D-Ala-D-Ala carboxypeptidase (penicillin-binding protein 5/6)